jgi:hypothetical protein
MALDWQVLLIALLAITLRLTALASSLESDEEHPQTGPGSTAFSRGIADQTTTSEPSCGDVGS